MKHLQANLSTYRHRTNPPTPTPKPISSTSIRHLKVYYTTYGSSIVHHKTMTFSEFLKSQEHSSFIKCMQAIQKSTTSSSSSSSSSQFLYFYDYYLYSPKCVSVNRLECCLVLALQDPNYASQYPDTYAELLDIYPEYFI